MDRLLSRQQEARETRPSPESCALRSRMEQIGEILIKYPNVDIVPIVWRFLSDPTVADARTPYQPRSGVVPARSSVCPEQYPRRGHAGGNGRVHPLLLIQRNHSGRLRRLSGGRRDRSRMDRADDATLQEITGAVLALREAEGTVGHLYDVLATWRFFVVSRRRSKCVSD